MRNLTESAKVSKLIRKELKGAFPIIKFSVTSKSYSMGCSVKIRYSNGPTTAAIEAITNKYLQGHFNSSEDLYESTNYRSDIPLTKYVFIERDIDISINEKALTYIKEKVGGIDSNAGLNSYIQDRNLCVREFINRLTKDIDLSDGLYEKDIDLALNII